MGDSKQTDGGGGGGAGEPSEVEVDEEDEVGVKKSKKVPNQFNFCERAALTYINPVRVCMI